MTKPYVFGTLLVLAVASLCASATEPEEALPLVREVFVPEADLNALLEGQPQRMLLSREEYEELLKKAEKTPVEQAPRKALLVAADYAATVEQGRALLLGKLELEVLEDGLWALPLDLSGCGVRRASLDRKAASLAQSGSDQLTLFVQGVGRHQLVLEMVAPMATTAARQRLTVRLPQAPASQLRLTVPGDVEIKSGADVAQRVVDEQAGVTRFELPTASGTLDLNLSLNSRLLRRDRVVVARSVFVDEITEAYERLHATVSMEVLHRAVERFEFAVPSGFEITDVATPQLARWAVSDRNGRRILEVQLREPATESVILTVSALRTDADLLKWQLPRFVPLDVVAESAVVGLLVDQRLIAETVSSDGLIPIDTSELRRALPETVFHAAPGAPPVRPIAAWYASQGEFHVAASFVKPPAEVAVTTNLLLILEDQQQRMQGGFLLAPEAEPLFEVELDIPPLWHVTSVTGADERPLSYERDGAVSEPGRVKLRLPRGVQPGQQYRVYFEAEAVPAGWLGEWETQAVEFPRFAVRRVRQDVGAIAVDARDDMIVQPDPDETQRLSILGKEDKAKHLAGLATDLAYRYESPDYRLPLVVARTTPRLTASTFSFLRVEPDAFVVHYEVIYDVVEARARRLSLVLPEGTPETVLIRGLDGVQLKEYGSSVEDGMRTWDVLLAEPRAGRIRLSVDFHQPLPVEDQKELPLPIVRADGVVWQSGHIAVEGDAELEVTVAADRRVRRVDVGELVDAEYQPGRRLLGVFGFVDTPGTMTVDVIRREARALVAAIVHRARLVSRLSAAGVCQTAAEFRLLTKVPLLEVTLPDKRAELWSGNVDGSPIKPQKEGDRWLINLPATAEGQIVTLQLVYEMPVAATEFRGHIDMEAPELRFRSEDDAEGQLVPIADLEWKLHPPSGCTVIDSSGTVMWQPDPPKPAVWTVARSLGGVLFGSPWLLAARNTVRQEAPQATARQLGLAYDSDVDFYAFDGAETTTAPLGEMPQLEGEEMELAGEAERGRPAFAVPQQDTPALPKSETASTSEERFDSFGVAGDPLLAKRLTPQRRGFKSASALRIELQAGPAEVEPVVTFTSLGDSPRLAVTLADGPGISKLGWGMGLLVLFVGLVLTTASVRRKLCYVLTVICLGSLIPLLESVFILPDASITLVPANMAVYAAGLLLPYYLVAGFARWLVQTGSSLLSPRKPAVAAACVLAACLVCMPERVVAEPPETRPYVVEIVDALPPVAIPDDAVVIPYDATKWYGVAKADRILVPYAKYVDLWNRAYPDAKKTATPPPAAYAPAGVSYQVTLVDDGDLLLDGRMELDVFVDERTEVPLGLDGGVFARAELDGQPAKLSVPEAMPVAANSAPAQQPAQQMEQQARVMESKPLVLLHVEGKGRHRFDFTVRMRLDRRGGWRTVSSRVPSAPAAAIEIRVPEAQTEVLLQQIKDRLTHETVKAGEEIRTALGPEGILDLQWRPSVAEGAVDHSLTAESTALLDVQEDGVRLAWNLQLEFRRSQHEQFSVHVPSDYLVKRVIGTNVRGWEVKQEESGSRVAITLLKAAEGREQFTLHLWRAEALGGDEATRLTAPTVRVDGAALHKGRITIRRSPMLDLRVEGVSGASRTDVPDDAGGKELANEQSPLGIRPFQAYRFGSTDFEIHLTAEPVQAKISAVVQSVLKIEEYERVLECRVRYTVQNRAMFQAEIFLPEAFDLQDVSAPGEFEWAVTSHEGRPKLTVLLASGHQGNVAIVFEGRLAREETGQDVAIPNVQVLGVPFSAGQMAVQADPAVDVVARELVGCRILLLDQIAHWLSKDQQHVTAVALAQSNADYSGMLRLSYRQPDVHCETITNIRVTDRALLETIFLDYRTEHAGVREVSFVLPPWMADARISVPMLRQKTIQPVSDEENSPVRVRLELQDEVMGQLRVLVENDRMLQTGVDFLAPIPKLIKGERFDAFSIRQFVALEKAGLDDIQLDDDASIGADRLNRRQLQWVHLASVLDEGITEAFLLDETNEKPQLAFRVRRFEARRTTDARIGMAETRFVLDESGAYRAEQLYKIDNKTEQYLEIEMPVGADLWTAQLWTFAAWTAHERGEPAVGEPIKPTRAPESAGPRRVRIPLIKTEEGDWDYVVRLQYAGTIGTMGTYARFDLPFIQPVGIKVDQSQVELFVPETYRFAFDDTMTLVTDEGDLAASRSAYETKKLESFKDVLREGNAFAKARALNSVTVLHDSRISLDEYTYNEKFRTESRRNQAALLEAQEAANEVEQSLQQQAEYDNRDRLRKQVDEQSNYFARNVIQNLGSNFEADRAAARGSTPAAKPDSGAFNSLWFDRSQLSNEAVVTVEEKAGKEAGLKADAKGKSRISSSRQWAAGRDEVGGEQASPGVSQKKMPAGTDRRYVDEDYDQLGERGTISDGEKQRQAVARYQERHRRQQQALGQSQDLRLGGSARGESPRGGMGGMGGGMGVGGGGFGGQLGQANQPMPQVGARPTDESAPEGPRALGLEDNVLLVAPLPTGLASLDVNIPFRGRKYLFTTPQGDVRITGYAVAAKTVSDVTQIVTILVLVAVAAYVVYLGTRGRYDWWLGRTGSTCLIALGLLAFLCLPVIGLLATVGGVMIKVNRAMAGREKSGSPFAAGE